MKPAFKGVAIALFSLQGLVGCDTVGSTPEVQAVAIKSSDFCEIVDKQRDLTWSVSDSKTTITNLRRLGAKWDSRCAKRN